jgi:hypothetical protein
MLVPPIDTEPLTIREQQRLARYKPWIEAVLSRELPLTTKRRQHLIEFCERNYKPRYEIEHLMFRWHHMKLQEKRDRFDSLFEKAQLIKNYHQKKIAHKASAKQGCVKSASWLKEQSLPNIKTNSVWKNSCGPMHDVNDIANPTRRR